MLIKLRYTVGLCLLLFVSTLWAEVAIPNLSQHVTDLTATLNAEQIAALETKLAAFEAKKGSQIAVLLLPTTQPEDIAAFGIRVADVWKIGRKNIDDGVILIIAKDDRKSRLEVGRGLEGVIPDAIAKRVLAETIRPYFKNGDYAGGVDAGVTQLIGLIEGETLPAPQAGDTSSDGFDTFLIILFFCCIVVELLFSSLFGGGIGAVVSSISIGAISAGVASFLALDIWVAVFMGIGMYFFLKLFYMGGGGGSSGGGSSWSGGSSSSSDWGGGGGGFSGGGASDSW